MRMPPSRLILPLARKGDSRAPEGQGTGRIDYCDFRPFRARVESCQSCLRRHGNRRGRTDGLGLGLEVRGEELPVSIRRKLPTGAGTVHMFGTRVDPLSRPAPIHGHGEIPCRRSGQLHQGIEGDRSAVTRGSRCCSDCREDGVARVPLSSKAKNRGSEMACGYQGAGGGGSVSRLLPGTAPGCAARREERVSAIGRLLFGLSLPISGTTLCLNANATVPWEEEADTARPRGGQK